MNSTQFLFLTLWVAIIRDTLLSETDFWSEPVQQLLWGYFYVHTKAIPTTEQCSFYNIMQNLLLHMCNAWNSDLKVVKLWSLRKINPEQLTFPNISWIYHERQRKIWHSWELNTRINNALDFCKDCGTCGEKQDTWLNIIMKGLTDVVKSS